MNPPGVNEWPPLSSVTMTTPGGYFFNCEKKKGSRFKRLEAAQVLLTAAAGVVNPQIESTFQNSQKPWSSVKSDMYFSAMQWESYYVPAYLFYFHGFLKYVCILFPLNGGGALSLTSTCLFVCLEILTL